MLVYRATLIICLLWTSRGIRTQDGHLLAKILHPQQYGVEV